MYSTLIHNTPINGKGSSSGSKESYKRRIKRFHRHSTLAPIIQDSQQSGLYPRSPIPRCRFHQKILRSRWTNTEPPSIKISTSISTTTKWMRNLQVPLLIPILWVGTRIRATFPGPFNPWKFLINSQCRCSWNLFCHDRFFSITVRLCKCIRFSRTSALEVPFLLGTKAYEEQRG